MDYPIQSQLIGLNTKVAKIVCTVRSLLTTFSDTKWFNSSIGYPIFSCGHTSIWTFSFLLLPMSLMNL